MDLQWIDSAGGPLLCASRSAAKQWRGTQASSIGATESDYARACQAVTYLSIIACGSENALVLGDEPMQSAFVTSPEGLLIVRWVSCESYDVASSALRALPSLLPSVESPVRFKVCDAGLLMFDSAADGSAGLTSVETGIESGDVLVTTEKYVSRGQFDFVVHRFLRS